MNRSICLLIAVVLSACAPLTPPPRGEKIVHNLVYKVPPDGRALRLDIYEPKGEGPHPVVVWIHGGGWKYGNKGWQLYLRKLTQYGFAIASVEYRLSDRAVYPAQYDDCLAAVGWLEAHAAKYDLDRKNFFVAGASAGGHLSALLGLQKGKAIFNAVCAMYPVTNIPAFGGRDIDHGYVPDLLGGSINQKLKLAEAASPVNYVTGKAPPFFIFHGKDDKLVTIEQSRELDRLLHRAGVESNLVELPGQEHGFTLTDAQVARVAEFFKMNLR